MTTEAFTPAGRIRGALQDTATITWRDMIRTARQPEMLMFAVRGGSTSMVE